MPQYISTDLALDLRRLGVEAGDILFVHSSFKSLGPVVGGAIAVIEALEAAVGTDGLLLMPSFNLVEWEERAQTWDHATTPSTVGWITEQFRQLPGVHRSDHYSHAVTARGRGAEAFVADHLRGEGMDSPWDLAPWGKTYGVHSPMYRAYEAGAKLLMLGVDYESSTYVHLVEVMYWNRLRQKARSEVVQRGESQLPAVGAAASRREADGVPYPLLDRPGLGAYWERTGSLQRGSVGDADCRLFSVRVYVDALLAEVERNAELYLL